MKVANLFQLHPMQMFQFKQRGITIYKVFLVQICIISTFFYYIVLTDYQL